MDLLRRCRQPAALVTCVVAVTAILPSPAPAAAPCRRTVERVSTGTWTARAVPGLAGSRFSWRMGVDQRDPRLIVVADYEGILVTRDGGCRWTRSLPFADAAPPLTLIAEDVEVAAEPGGRALYVLASTAPDVGPKLLSSRDDGATWEVSDVPPEAAAGDLDTARLSSGPARAPSTTYLLTVHRTGHGGVFARAPGEGAWAWRAATAPEMSSAACAPGGPCTAPPLRALQADPRSAATVWGLAASSAAGSRRLVRSGDDGSTWEEMMAPGLLGGPTLMDVADGGPDATVMLLDGFRHFALSRDAGTSWQVGALPKLSSSAAASGPSFDLAHEGRTGSFAALLGLSSASAWAGNLLVFDGEEWTNASPLPFAGYDRTDEDGKKLSLTELTGSRDSFLVLSSRGELMSFRPRS